MSVSSRAGSGALAANPTHPAQGQRLAGSSKQQQQEKKKVEGGGGGKVWVLAEPVIGKVVLTRGTTRWVDASNSRYLVVFLGGGSMRTSGRALSGSVRKTGKRSRR